jgi:hypothetical protein
VTSPLANLAAQQSFVENLYFLINMQYRRHLGLELRVLSLHIVSNLYAVEVLPASRSYAAWSTVVPLAVWSHTTTAIPCRRGGTGASHGGMENDDQHPALAVN